MIPLTLDWTQYHNNQGTKPSKDMAYGPVMQRMYKYIEGGSCK